jgi:hypothetical protein
MSSLRVLFFPDTHLGFDDPVRPRVQKQRRGPDFFASFRRVLSFARAEQVDFVIHGGDLFYRSRVPDALIDRVMAPLVELADSGTPVSAALRVLAEFLDGVDPSAVLRIRIPEELVGRADRVVAGVKALVPSTMILNFRFPPRFERSRSPDLH